MRVWVYVEGESDRLALEALWDEWLVRLGKAGHGIRLLALGSKPRFLRRIGHLAAEKLVNNAEDLVVGLPDLYPNHEYTGTPYKHDDHDELAKVQTLSVTAALAKDLKVTHGAPYVDRFYATALKHDLEMLLLAAKSRLRAYLGTRDNLGNWRHPVEEQNQHCPPKRIVEDLFRSKSVRKRAYRATVDAPAILRQVRDRRDIIHDHNSNIQCPCFKELLNWIGTRSGVPAYI